MCIILNAALCFSGKLYSYWCIMRWLAIVAIVLGIARRLRASAHRGTCGLGTCVLKTFIPAWSCFGVVHLSLLHYLQASNWEGGIRVNAFASGGAIPASVKGQKFEGLSTIWDWYATFTEGESKSLSRMTYIQNTEEVYNGNADLAMCVLCTRRGCAC